MINTKLLAEICEVAGAPGHEQRVREIVLREVKPLVDEIKIDNMGNVLAIKKGKKNKSPIIILIILWVADISNQFSDIYWSEELENAEKKNTYVSIILAKIVEIDGASHHALYLSLIIWNKYTSNNVLTPYAVALAKPILNATDSGVPSINKTPIEEIMARG